MRRRLRISGAIRRGSTSHCRLQAARDLGSGWCSEPSLRRRGLEHHLHGRRPVHAPGRGQEEPALGRLVFGVVTLREERGVALLTFAHVE